MSVTAAKGFAAAGVACGIRKNGRRDVAIVRSLVPATGAAMFTTNRFLAAPVVVSREHLELAQPQAIVVNSGVANAATGDQGVADARATAVETARLLGLEPEEVIVLSTGVIGTLLPLDKVIDGVRDAALHMSRWGGATSAEAIMTTDTRPKEALVHGSGFTVGGMSKGSGMIHPNLATMLAVLTTDYPLEPGEAIEFLRPAVDTSFNAISVDGECSTNDAVVLLANGASGTSRSARAPRRISPPISRTTTCGSTRTTGRERRGAQGRRCIDRWSRRGRYRPARDGLRRLRRARRWPADLRGDGEARPRRDVRRRPPLHDRRRDRGRSLTACR